MKKRHVTKTFLKGFKNVIRLGYCEGYYLLRGLEPNVYNAGAYGWNYDGYVIDNDTIIITGYRPDYGQRVKFETVAAFERSARIIATDNGMAYNVKMNELRRLRRAFITEVIA